MVRIRPTDTELIKKLTDLKKPYFTVSDLERVLGLKKKSLYVTLNRLTKSGILKRLKKNVYAVFTGEVDTQRIANEIYFPSYLSFEKALANHGIYSQMPFTLTFATSRPSKKLTIAGTQVEYSHIKRNLFFGYEVKSDKNIALPEKALLDELYMMGRGLRKINLDELDLKDINRQKLMEFAEKFPPYTKELLKQVEGYIGTTPVTGEAKERIGWRK